MARSKQIKICKQIAESKNHPWAASIAAKLEQQKKVKAMSKWIQKQLIK